MQTLALVHAPPRAGQYHHYCAAAEVTRAQPGRERLEVHARLARLGSCTSWSPTGAPVGVIAPYNRQLDPVQRACKFIASVLQAGMIRALIALTAALAPRGV